MTCGEKIREYRKKLGYTQSDLANKVGMKTGTISKYEKDEITIPSDTLCKIANVLDVSTDYLLGRTNVSNTINESIPIAASTKDSIDLSDVSNEDKKAIMRFVEMAKNKNKNKNKKD